MPGLGRGDRRVWRYAFIYPNTTIDLYPDQVNTWQMLPDGVARTSDVFRLLPAAGTDPRTRLVQWANQRLNTLVLDEDIDLVDNVQQGLQTRGLPLRPAVAPRGRRRLVRRPDPRRPRAALATLSERLDRREPARRARADPRRRRAADRERGHRRGARSPASRWTPGSPRSLVHYHFASREALLAEALDYSYAHAGAVRLGCRRCPGADSHAERLAAMIDQCLPTHARRSSEDWVLWVELWLRAVRHPELRPVAEELYARLHAWFADEIAAGVAAGEFARCDPQEVADRTLALIDGFGIRTLIGDSTIPLERARLRSARSGARPRPRRAARRAAGGAPAASVRSRAEGRIRLVTPAARCATPRRPRRGRSRTAPSM